MNFLQRLIQLIVSLLAGGSQGEQPSPSQPPPSGPPSQEQPGPPAQDSQPLPFDHPTQPHPAPSQVPHLPLNNEPSAYSSPAEPMDSLGFEPIPFDPIPEQGRR